MSLLNLLGRAMRRALMGPPGLAAAFDFPLTSPQQEVTVWLHGLGEPQDVTSRHAVACPIPFTICIGLEEGCAIDPPARPFLLRFVEQAGARKVLGEMRLHHQEVVMANQSQLHLFRAVGCRNFCFSPFRDWTRSFYAGWKSRKGDKLQVSALDSRCNEVIFSCPRPTVLVSLRDGCRGNVFPMNLMGQISQEIFVFALNRKNMAAARVSAIRELAVCTVPFKEAERVRQLGRNHYKASAEWEPFTPSTTCLSPTLHIPIPDFVLASTELKIQNELVLGSHIFFVAQVVGRHVRKSAPEFYRIHGTYATQRARTRKPKTSE